MDYVDGFVLAVEKTRKQEYIDFATECAKVFKKHGALSVIECWGDDVPDGELTSFPMAVKCKEDEVVCFSWITWPDKGTRDKGMEAAMQDPSFSNEDTPLPFDGKRMIFGGFNMIVRE